MSSRPLSIVDKKDALRKELRRILKDLPVSETEAANKEMARLIKALPEYGNAKTVFCYISTGREPGTRELLRDMEQRGVRIAVPLCTAPGIMEARLISGMQDVIAGSFGLLEPKAQTEIIRPHEIDFAVIPCMGCGRDGTRLGKGGGYYDRFLKGKVYKTAALCYEQLMTETVPHDAHDLSPDYIITQKGQLEIES